MSLDQYKAARNAIDSTDLLALFDSIETDATRISAESKPAFMVALLDDLDQLPDQSRWTEHVTTRAIQILKLLGRDTAGADALFSERGIKTLLKLGGLSSPNSPTDTAQAREALKCLSNCILLDEGTKKWVVQHDGVAALFHLLQSSTLSTESQFLTCRILFLMTVNNPDLVKQLIGLDVPVVLQNVLVSNVNKLLANEPQLPPINASSVASEALKLLFNLMLVDIRTSDDEEAVGKRFTCCLPPIYDIIFNMPLQEPMPLVPPYTHAIHALMQYPYDAMSVGWHHYPNVTRLHTTREDGRENISQRLCDILLKSLAYLIPTGDPDDLEATTPSGINVDATFSPLLLVLRRIATGEPGFVEFLRLHMLPSDTDRNLPVNRGKSTSAQLIRLMTSTILPQTRDAICECLFVLCNEDASQFTQEVGYGNAIGFLVNRGIAVEPPQGFDTNDPNKQINPITGQYMAAEETTGPSLAEMTDEEKEREAERLFVLFERLKKNGVIKAENPVVQAMREGKLQELSDSSDDDN